jgi:hypothetical protein
LATLFFFGLIVASSTSGESAASLPAGPTAAFAPVPSAVSAVVVPEPVSAPEPEGVLELADPEPEPEDPHPTSTSIPSTRQARAREVTERRMHPPSTIPTPRFSHSAARRSH